MDATRQQLSADPYCGQCGYALKGLTDSSRCPECGRPIVETLVRTGMPGLNGVRFRSGQTILGLPLVCIASGPVANEKFGHARGFVAIGDVATGVIAIGGFARGIIAIGGGAIGACALGGITLGGVAVGGISIGLIAIGGVALGLYAWGGSVFYFIKGFGGARIRLPWFW